MRSRLIPSFVVGCLGLAAAAAGPGAAFDGTADARLHGLDRTLSGVATRTRSAPRSTGVMLDDARRELRRIEVDLPPGDPEVGRLRREITRLQTQADRASRRRGLDASLRRLEGVRGALPLPDYARSPVDTDLRGPQPIGAGKLFIFVQDLLRDTEGHLRRGPAGVGAAAGALAEAERALARLDDAAAGAGLPGDDPNLVAARSQAAALRARLTSLDRTEGPAGSPG